MFANVKLRYVHEGSSTNYELDESEDDTESLKYLEAAHRVAPHVPIIAEHLGDVYVKQAMIEKARNMYGRAIATETEKDKLAELHSKMSSIEIKQDRQPASAP